MGADTVGIFAIRVTLLLLFFCCYIFILKKIKFHAKQNDVNLDSLNFYNFGFYYQYHKNDSHKRLYLYDIIKIQFILGVVFVLSMVFLDILF